MFPGPGIYLQEYISGNVWNIFPGIYFQKQITRNIFPGMLAPKIHVRKYVSRKLFRGHVSGNRSPDSNMCLEIGFQEYFFVSISVNIWGKYLCTQNRVLGLNLGPEKGTRDSIKNIFFYCREQNPWEQKHGTLLPWIMDLVLAWTGTLEGLWTSY